MKTSINLAMKCPFSGSKIDFRKNSIKTSDEKPFVSKNSIVRKIWGKSDVILFIFAGGAAEFALNKTVDWLYFTGKLPSDPLGRMFSTVEYARKIVFASETDAHQTIITIYKIHSAVEQKRGYPIPDWGYRDVLFMLMYYSIASYELLERKLLISEKEEVYTVFAEVGKLMGVEGIPENYQAWLVARDKHLEENLEKSFYTEDLYSQYKKHLGLSRYKILLEAQKLVVPKKVKELLQFNDFLYLSPTVPVYKLLKALKLDDFVKAILLPSEYKTQINALEIH